MSYGVHLIQVNVVLMSIPMFMLSLSFFEISKGGRKYWTVIYQGSFGNAMSIREKLLLIGILCACGSVMVDLG